jgi:2-iminobutanoate/2-iminopropanoate deaminase
MPHHAVRTVEAPAPAGAYSQAIVHAGLVYVSGQLPIDPVRGPLGPGEAPGPVAEQTRRVLKNLEAVLRAAGSSPAHVLRTTVYVAGVEHWGEVNREYGAFFAGHGATPPARSVVPTGTLHYGYAVEIDAIAAVAGGGA